MNPTPKQIAIGLATVAAIFGGIITGTVTVQHDDLLHARVEWPGAVPADVACARIVAVAPSEAWALLGLPTDKPDYAVGYVCAPQSGADVEAMLAAAQPNLGGVWIVEQAVVPFEPGMAQLELWSARSPNAPAVCACAPLVAGETPCEWLRPVLVAVDAGVADDGGEPAFQLIEEWGPAPTLTNLDPGRWRGGCVPKPACLDALGAGSSLPVSCGGSAGADVGE